MDELPFRILLEGARLPRTKATNGVFGEDVLLSSIARAIGEPARTRILLSLLDGYARTSTELAALAEVSPSTASVHLNRLTESGLIRVAAEGRHRYYTLRGPQVARLLESLGVLAGGAPQRFVSCTPQPMRRARSCYDHMAGSVAVALHDRFIGEGWLISNLNSAASEYELSSAGTKILDGLGIDVAGIRPLRRRFAFGCLDWSERRPHIAGALGTALLKHALEKKWVIRELNSRALSLTRFGEMEILRTLGLKLTDEGNVNRGKYAKSTNAPR